MTTVDRDLLTVLVVADDGVACDRLGDAVRSSIPCRVTCEHQGDGSDTIALVDADVAVIDEGWFEGSGPVARAELRRLAREVPVVVLALPGSGGDMTPLNRQQLREAVETAVSDGGTRLYVLDGPEPIPAPAPAPVPSSGPGHFSEREMDVLGRMAAGYSNRDISLQLGVTVATVKFHVSNVLRKLEARSRAHAVSMALHDGILRPADVVRRMPPSA